LKREKSDKGLMRQMEESEKNIKGKENVPKLKKGTWKS
jgi:hypothetical protein